MNNFDLRKYLAEGKLHEETKPDTGKLVDFSEKVAADLAKNPKELQQYLTQAKSAGIDMDQVVKAAKQLKAGSSPESVLKSIFNSLDEATIDQAKQDQKAEYSKEILSKMGIGAGIASIVPIASLALSIATPALLTAILITTLAGALTGLGASMGALRDTRKDSGGKTQDRILLDKASKEFSYYSNEKLLDRDADHSFYTRLSTPDKSLFYIVDTGITPPELKGKKVYRISIEDRDVVGDEEALFKSRIKRGQEKEKIEADKAKEQGSSISISSVPSDF
jgi:hypothetical protein